jgi:hypothetical protein
MFSFGAVWHYIGATQRNAKSRISMSENGVAPTLWLIAGANGVGKTSYARTHIAAFSGSKSFVNLNEIARGLSPFDPEAEKVRAARVALNYLTSVLSSSGNGHDSARKSITLETTLAGLTHDDDLTAQPRIFRPMWLKQICGACLTIMRSRVLWPKDAAIADLFGKAKTTYCLWTWQKRLRAFRFVPKAERYQPSSLNSGLSRAIIKAGPYSEMRVSNATNPAFS